MVTLTLNSTQKLDTLTALYNYRSTYISALENASKTDYIKIANCKSIINNVNSIIKLLEKR